MIKFSLAVESIGYSTSPDPSNADNRLLVAGSQNVLIDYQKKIKSRSGYTRLGPKNSALTEIRNAWTWDTSTAEALPQRFYDQSLEVYLTTLDDVVIDDWVLVADGWSATEKMRTALWFDTTENLDVQVMVQNDANLYEWSGGLAVVDSVSPLNIVEAGDASNQMSAWAFTGLNATNSDGGILYWKITNSGSTRTVVIYKDSGGTAVVAQGSRSGDGVVTLATQNTSGLSGTVTIAYSGDDTTVSDNTLTCGYSVTKKGTNTFGQNRFYGARDLAFINRTSGAAYTYVDGVTTTTLTTVIPATGTMEIADGDILVQQIVTQTDTPASDRKNFTITSFENQIVVGSAEDNNVYISNDTDYTDFSFSSPRLSGEGALLTLDSPTRALSSLGKLLLMFAGRSSIFQSEFTQITVGTTLTESLDVIRLDIGIDQGALNQEVIIPIGNSIAYLTNETTLRVIQNPQNLTGIDPETYSNPIKPDFDAENWEGAFGIWYKNTLIYTAPENSHMYMLNFIEDANGKSERFWNPPQILPVGPMSVIDSGNGPMLHGHSNSVPESYLLFDGASDGQYADMDVKDKLPINAIAAYAYESYGDRADLKNFDEFYVEGEIIQSTTDLELQVNYDFDGTTQQLTRTIDGSDGDILEGEVGFNSLAQQSLALNPLGGLLNPPSNTRKFRVIFEIAKEDFHQMQAIFSTNEVDRYWAITAKGANAALSTRRDTVIRK